LQECADEWSLRLDAPYPPGAASYAVRADLPDGTPGVLKLIYPHRKAEHEAEALRIWDGEGAVRLLAYDETRWAMRIERCEPGNLLAEIEPDAGLDVLIGLLPRLWRIVEKPFRSLADEAAWWIDYLPTEWERTGRPFELSLLDEGIALLKTVSATQ